ncbi:MAG: cytochrome b [Aggregatilineales bacterium]
MDNSAVSVNRYSRVAQAFHWVSALLILIMAPMGLIMTRISEDSAKQLYQIHVILGITVLLLTIFRVLWVFFDERPEELTQLENWRKQVFIWNHRLIYIGLFVLSTSGLGMLLTSGVSLPPTNVAPEMIVESLPKKAHVLLSKIFIALLIIHIVGVISYQVTKGNTLARMGIPVRSSR